MPGGISQISVEELFESFSEKYALRWVAGHSGGAQMIPSAAARQKRGATDNQYDGGSALVGYLNLIHPHQIQIIGNHELRYLERLQDASLHDLINQLFVPDLACIVITHDNEAPAMLKEKCDEHKTPLLRSSLSSSHFMDSLRYHFDHIFADSLTLHGVLLEIHAIGVLLMGPSGVGKSELALELITRGHCLVADDAPRFTRLRSGMIRGHCPSALQDFLEVRGLGIINVRKLFGDVAIKPDARLGLIARLEPSDAKSALQINRLAGSYSTYELLETQISEITLPVALGGNLAILLECAARNHILRVNGYDAPEEFIKRQKNMIEENHVAE